MSILRIRKESIPFIIGFTCIAGIIIYYTSSYFKQNEQTPQENMPISTSFVTDETFISYDSLVQKRQENKDKVILIDIRSSDLFASEHIPQSTNIPFEFIDGLTVRDGFTFVIITSVGNEQGFGASAAQIIHDKNKKAPIFILQGGFEAWKQLSGQTISFGVPTSITDQAKVNYITIEQFKKDVANNKQYMIIDMRPKDEFDKGHIDKAVNLPLDQLESYYERIPLGSNIVVYGNSQLEDFQAGVRLFDLGFFSVKILQGGYNEWIKK